MTTTKLSSLVTRLQRRPVGADATDAELLARFVADRDEAAFTLIVRRHGPLVFGVCRRVTGDHHLAEDAFQAVFVVLAAKAGAVRPRSALAAWLYGVAYRTALRARTMAGRRRRHEQASAGLGPWRASSRQADVSEPERVELTAILDEEIARLPERSRLAVVLCELEGHSRKDAAARLGIPEGTLSSRLAAARKLLAARLRQRGVGLSVAFGQVASASVPPDLAARAVTAALAPSALPAEVAALSNGVLRVMFAQKLKAVSVVLVLVAAVTACGWLLSADRPDDPKPTVEKPVPADAPPGGRILLMRQDGLAVLSPDGKKLLAARLGPEECVSGWAWLSPDGKRLAYLVHFGALERQPRVMVRDLDGGKFATAIDVNAMYLLWAPDGKSLVATSYVTEIWAPLKVEHVRIDLAARTVTPLAWPDDVVPVHWSADGKTVVVVREGETRPNGHIGVMTADGKKVTELADISAADWHGHGYRLSPDGTKVLFSDVPPEGKDDFRGMTRRLYMLDVATKKKTEVAGVPENATVFWACWSPDGKQIAYTWRQRHADVVKKLAGKQVADPDDVTVPTEAFLVVADADGSNAKTIASGKADTALDMPLLALDWR